MAKFKRVLLLEVECATDKYPETPGGRPKYRRDSPWLVESFKKKGVESDILFITNKDSVPELVKTYPSTAFLGRVNPMDYPTLKVDEYIKLLEELNKRELLLGPFPEHMDRLGSKMILYELRDTLMGVDGILLHHYKDMKAANGGEIDRILPTDGPPRVLKMLRGSTGLCVWKLENKDAKTILMTDAYKEQTDVVPRNDVLRKFCQLCQQDAISMPFLPRIKDGEIRFLMSKHRVLAVVNKRPVDDNAFAATVYTILDTEDHNSMVDAIVNWSHWLKERVGFDHLPYWWSVDCIEADGVTGTQIPSSNPGRHLVLSEINCSCVGLTQVWQDTSEEARMKDMLLADMIADICIG